MIIPVTEMTLDQCLKARVKEEAILDRMLDQTPPVSMNILLEQNRKLESLDFWIERKSRTEPKQEQQNQP